jgi:hypothetical protein
MREIEFTFTCPYCLEAISMLLDPSVPEQEYVEDCEVCCHPILLHYEVSDGAVAAFEVRRLDT